MTVPLPPLATVNGNMLTANVAVSERFAVTPRVSGLAVAVVSPLQFTNDQPSTGDAVSCTGDP